MQKSDIDNSDQNVATGFKAFASLATQLGESEILKKETSPKFPTNETDLLTQQQEPITEPAPSSKLFEVAHPKKTYEWGNIFIFISGMIFVAFVIYSNYFSASEQSSESSYSYNPSSSTTNHSSSYNHNYLIETKPSHSPNPIYGINNINYCLAEKIRLDASKERLNQYDNSDIDNYNEYVKDYNYLCSSYRYRQKDFEVSSRLIDVHKEDLIQQGYKRFSSHGYTR